GPIIGVNPATGTLGTRPPATTGLTTTSDCERDRFALSQLDDGLEFRTLLDEANRWNTSFYPIDPRGLAVFDENIVPAAGVGVGREANRTLTPLQETSQLTARGQGLRALAAGTVGFAVIATNTADTGLEPLT